MSATPLYQRRSPSQYRTDEYRNGDVVRIQETRRRRPTAELRTDPSSIQRAQHSKKRDDSEPSEAKTLGNKNEDCRSTARRISKDGGAHVTPSLISSGKGAKPVICQPLASYQPQRQKTGKTFGMTAMPTPPPTPEIGRLATPELEELEDSPFCECCDGIHIAKYCASCGINLDRY